MLRRWLNNKLRRATNADLGKKVAVLWNPQGVSDFGEKAIWREGVIDEILDDGGFWINFGGAIMICPAINRWSQRVNPFRNIKEL